MAISFKNSVKNLCVHLGKNNNPAYAVVAIAAAKGVCRPIFTMMDKKESPEAKKYTALREGLTEVIAIPTYLACGALAAKGAKLIKDPQKAKIAEQNLRFLGVCTAASLIIPGLCLVAVNRFENLFKKDASQPENIKQNLDIVSRSEVPFKSENFAHINNLPTNYRKYNVSMTSFLNSEMRVG